MVTKKTVTDAMTKLGVYKPEFDLTIERYVRLSSEYSKLQKAYKAGGYQFEVVTASGSRKSPIVTTLEGLRRDLLTLEDSLGLTPKGLRKLQENSFEKIAAVGLKKDSLV